MVLLFNQFEIYIPTYGRSDLMSTHKIFPEAVIVCPESQLEAYQKNYPNLRYKPCPDETEGNMAKKRNWIKDHAESDWFIMVDDDIDYFQYVEDRKGKRMQRDHLLKVFHNCFQMCEDAGTVLWGINLQTDPMFYKETSPLSFLSVVLGPFSGHIKNDLRYDERLPTKEDYDYSLQVLHKYHKIIRWNKYAYKAGHINSGSGGSHSFRRMKLEEDQNIILQKKWGKKIVKFDMSKDIDPIVKIPLKGI